ncbi:MAG: hypothetical protein AB1705_09095 [Verrucomicrobiota bacterium]
MKFNSQRGVALITTLIMLSIITFTAVVFLAVTNRERASVRVTQSLFSAKSASDSGFYHAQALVIAQIMASTNRFGYDLMVSTNYVAPFYLGDEANITNIAGLQFLARAPVYIQTNATGPLDYRFFVDFNRNRFFEPNGWYEETNNLGAGMGVTNYYVGDLEWIGVLEHPEYPHSSSNRFIGRYAFLVLPAGKSLDLNFIHNYAKRLNSTMATFNDGFLRNQGVGPWEINLAAFLRDLNTNSWSYVSYETNIPPFAVRNDGTAFDDALSLLKYRYNDSYANLQTLSNAFDTNAGYLATNFIDELAHGPLMTGTGLLTVNNDSVFTNWPGGLNLHSNSVSYFDIQDLFATGRPYSTGLPNFLNTLRNSMTNNSTYDRYTFYRLLAQLGVDSATPLRTKVHLNYDNVNTHQTNFVEWAPTNFFRETAERLLSGSFGFSLVVQSNKIQLYPSNQYSAAVHRLMQVAANIYDASTNKGASYPYYPTVFRPIFTNSGTNILIHDYVEETNATFAANSYLTFEQLTNQPAGLYTNINLHGVPAVIGVKKGYPNFNEFSLQTFYRISRRMEVRKSNTNAPGPGNVSETNLMYELGISNVFGVEAWNSYTNPFPRDLVMTIGHDMTIVLTNQLGSNLWGPVTLTTTTNINIPANSWIGANAIYANPTNFLLPLSNSYTFLTNSQFFVNTTPIFQPSKDRLAYFETNNSASRYFYVPEWGLAISNRVRYLLTDNGRVVDFVNVADLNEAINLTEELATQPTGFSDLNGLWDTNRVNASTNVTVPTLGMIKQMDISLGRTPATWQDYNLPPVPSKDLAIAQFQKFMFGPGFAGNPRYRRLVVTNLNMQVPYTPSAVVYHRRSWQANDPLVHYMREDLTDLRQPSKSTYAQTFPPGATTLTNLYALSNLRQLNDVYTPWAGRRYPGGPSLDATNQYAYDYMVKDPMVRWSDDWNFPAGKFGSIGWLGRVHRGTPWQTLYMKAPAAPNDAANNFLWTRWSGDSTTNSAAHPTNDWTIVDIFTVDVDDRASRSKLSVNQTNIAAWSAVLSGVLVLSNRIDYEDFFNNPPSRAQEFDDLAITPGTPQMLAIYNGINAYRDTLTNQTPTNVFTRLGQILGVPQLTVELTNSPNNSPYVNFTSLNAAYGVTDVVLERIPQQILSLLTVEDHPRVVIYAYGQSLRPADRSIVVSGPYRGLCTNYQITGEVLTRAAVRFENAPATPRAVVENFTVLSTD